MNKEVIGIDLGGTSIKGGRIKDGELIDLVVEPTPVTDQKEEVLQAISKVINSLMTTNVRAIGFGLPGVVDIEKGIVYDVMNIPSWKEVYIKEIFEAEFKIPVFVNNDANCFAMGEKIYGVGNSINNFVGVTLGTGLGAGIIQKGRLLNDANCGSGEFCIVPYLDSDYENYCSGMYFKNRSLNGVVLGKLAREGNKEAFEVFEQFGRHIADLVKLIVATIDPEMIVFGGSVAESFDYYKESMQKSLDDFPYQNSIKKLKIEVSNTPHQAIFGAASLCH